MLANYAKAANGGASELLTSLEINVEQTRRTGALEEVVIGPVYRVPSTYNEGKIRQPIPPNKHQINTRIVKKTFYRGTSPGFKELLHGKRTASTPSTLCH